jgi:hypothetical protein
LTAPLIIPPTSRRWISRKTARLGFLGVFMYANIVWYFEQLEVRGSTARRR